MTEDQSFFDPLDLPSIDLGDDQDAQRPQAVAPDAETSSAYSAWLKSIFLATIPSSVGPELLRSIVERDLWFVPTKPDGAFDVLDVKPGRYRLAIEDPLDAPSRKQTRRRSGKGGQLLPISSKEPDGQFMRIDGRSLARAIPAEVDGILLGPGEQPRELGRAYLDQLPALADACDLKDILGAPGPDQTDPLLSATWFVQLQGDRLQTESSTRGGRLAEVYTHRDRGGYHAQDLVALDGARLFRLCAEDEDVDGLLVNRGHYIGRGTRRIANLLISPGIACGLLRGHDLRPGATPLPARSRAEIELWLDLHGFPLEGRELVEAPYPERTLVRATAASPRVGHWRDQETLDAQEDSDGRWSPVFTIGADDVGQAGLGDQPSQILCPGLLAAELGAGSYMSQNPASYWRVGRWLLLGRLVDGWNRERSRHRAGLAGELAKLLPSDGDRIPRSAILTVEGAMLFARSPHARTRSWIEATARQANRYTSRWVWGR